LWNEQLWRQSNVVPLVAQTPKNQERFFTNVIIVVGGGAVVMAMKGKNVPAVKRVS